MSARQMMVAVVLGLSAGQALAQPAAQPAREKEPDAKQVRQMYEDVAVFRTLLNRAVVRAYGLTLQKTVPSVYGSRNYWSESRSGNPYSVGAQYPRDNVHAHALSFALAEGVYLPGQGVVFNLSAPTPWQDPLAAVTGAAAKGISPWERARRELRGDKVAEAKEATPRQASLSEALLRLLSENGQHFKELADSERITVAVTFRGGSNCMSCHGATSGMKQQGLGSGVPPAPLRVRGSSTLGGGGQGTTTTGSDKEIQDQSTVGDLHMRQGRYKEAAQAYELALKRLLRQRENRPQKTEADVQRLLLAVELANRLTRAAEGAGLQAAAQRCRDLSLRYAKAALELSESLKGKPAEKGTIALPARLIVSAPKKLLDQVGAGKLSFAEFRKAATVQYLRFPRPEK